MPDNSPEGRLPFTEDDVRLLADELEAITDKTSYRDDAQHILSTLARWGRLVPPDLTEQFGVSSREPIGNTSRVYVRPMPSRSEAEELIADPVNEGYPLLLVHRWRTPWVEVDRNPTDG